MHRILITGERACFTRPELSVERVSYDVPTPSALIGILEAIYRKPEMRWHINSITILSPIKWGSIRRNELRHKSRVSKPYNYERTQRHMLYLVDVGYVVEASIETLKPDDRNPGCNVAVKHNEIFARRLASGQHFAQPVLGCREFPATVMPADGAVEPHLSLKGDRDYGLMLHTRGWDGAKNRYYRAVARDGVIRVPSINSPEVLS